MAVTSWVTSFFACVLRACSNAPEAPVMRRAASVAIISITTVNSIRVKARAPLAQLSVLGSRLSGGPAARLRGIMRKFVQGVVEIRSLNLGQSKRMEQGARNAPRFGYRLSVLGYQVDKGSRITGPVAAGRGERWLSVIRLQAGGA